MTENATVTDIPAAPYPTDDSYSPPPATTTPRIFRRSRTEKMLGGVCGGAAEALGVDVTLLRIALVAATILGFGSVAVIYLVCWLVVPEAD